MDKSLIEQYKQEMMNMYRTGKTVPVQTNITETPKNTTSQSTTDDKGGLVAVVTTFRRLYPVPNARVTVFTGNTEDKQVIATEVTDQSGRTGVIRDRKSVV